MGSSEIQHNLILSFGKRFFITDFYFFRSSVLSISRTRKGGREWVCMCVTDREIQATHTSHKPNEN